MDRLVEICLPPALSLSEVYLTEPAPGYQVIHQFQGKKVHNHVDDLWETVPDGG